ncbi:MAG: hypothetical protein KF791_00080 [Verrucomicrobiae bacterium]|nr:hypothetical protein [Verrucomicrobiae bacterium]
MRLERGPRISAPCRGRGATPAAWTVLAPREGQRTHFTREFEAFALTRKREMPVKKAGQILGENNTRH